MKARGRQADAGVLDHDRVGMNLDADPSCVGVGDGVAQQVLEGSDHAVEHAAVDFDGAALDVQPHGLAAVSYTHLTLPTSDLV